MMKFLKLDFISQEPKLFIQGETRHQNNFGALQSVVCVILIVLAAGFFLSDFVQRTAPTIVYNQVYSNFSVLNMSKMPIMWMIQDSNYVPLANPARYWRSYAQLFASEPSKDSGGNNIAILTKTELYFEPCNIDKHFGEYKELFKDMPFLNLYQCMNLEKNNITLSGIYGNSKFSYLNVYIIRCTNDPSVNRTNCYDMDKINNDLDNVRISIKFLDYMIDHNDLNTPGKLIIRSEAPQITTSTFKRFWYYMRVVNYTSDYGYITPDYNRDDFFQGQDTTETVDLRKAPLIPYSFCLFSFLMDRKIDTYQRTFLKAQTVLANIGGITNGIVIIAQLINWVVSRRLYFLFFINDLIMYESCIKGGDAQKENSMNTKMKNFEVYSESGNSPFLYNMNLFKIKSLERRSKMGNAQIQSFDKKILDSNKTHSETLLNLDFFQMIIPLYMFRKNSESYKNLVNYYKFENKIKLLMDLRL